MTLTTVFHSPDRATTALFVVLLLLVIAAFLAAVRHAARAEGQHGGRRMAFAAIGMLVWLSILGEFVAKGAILAAPMPALLIFMGASNLMALAVGLSPVGGAIARGVPVAALVAFQAFRLPLEFILHDWARQGVIPHNMTWSGAPPAMSNFDVITGLVALVATPFAARRRGAAWIANIVGIVLLANVARVAVFSSPLPFAWHVEPPLLLAATLPYAMIVPVCVAGALLGHVVLTRALLGGRRDGAAR